MSHSILHSRRSGWATIILVFAALSAAAVPSCKFTSCADTNSCAPEPESASPGGQGGQGGAPRDEGGDGSPLSIECQSGEVYCESRCTDPQVSTRFCGASADCLGKNAGESCGRDEICFQGKCQPECLDDQVVCDDTCVDPLSNDEYCGADAGCGEYAECSKKQECLLGTCASWGTAGIVDFGDGPNHNPTAPSLGLDGDGTAVVSWVRPDLAASFDLKTSQLIPGPMLWSAPEIHDARNDPVLEPQMDVNEAGEAAIVWLQIASGVERQVRAVTRESDGTWTPPVKLSGIPAGAVASWEASSPQVAVDDAGNAQAVWIEKRDSEDVVVSNYFDASTGAWGVPVDVVIDAGRPWAPSRLELLSLSGGRFLLAIVHDTETGNNWFSAVSEGGEFGTATEVFDAPESGTVSGVAFAAAQNDALVFWSVYDGTFTAPKHGWVSFFSDSAWSAPVLIEQQGSSDMLQLQAALGPDGEAVITWVEAASRLRWGRGTVGSEVWQIVEDPIVQGSGDQIPGGQTLAADGLGNFQLAWVQETDGAASAWGARLRHGTDDWSTPRLLEDLDEPVGGLSLAFSESGKGVVAWWVNDPTDRALGFNYFQ